MAQTISEPALDAPPTRHRNTSRKHLRRQEAFVTAYTTPGAPTYLNGTRSALAAGYAPKAASQQATRLVHKPHIKEAIEARLETLKIPALAPAPVSGGSGVPWVQEQHVDQMWRCLKVGDRSNAREHLVMYGKTVGAYDATVNLDVTVKHEYDERMEVECSRLARIALEQGWDGRSLAPEPVAGLVVDAEHEPAPAQAQEQDVQQAQAQPAPAPAPEQQQEPDLGPLSGQDPKPPPGADVEYTVGCSKI